MAIPRLFTNLRRNLPSPMRNFSLTGTRNLKEIRETKEGNTITVEGILLPDETKNYLKPSEEGACSLCSAGVDVKHTDVLILQQFLRRDGCMLPRRITGLCKVQQKRVGIMVAMAQKAGLMPNLAPKNSKKDPKRRPMWKRYNTYFDENTIKQRYY
ncbi:hypothetical protein QAD02_005564 [Eretmocerus hayati]|uniref:Uncharacterized protein n=1 Tax=Eretmocerus hayati TaxID=131215 RepID=A0ACC2NT62_9HYME|nr:hypothetical protein QAD02_005564 [Eretmocerus hayati]